MGNVMKTDTIEVGDWVRISHSWHLPEDDWFGQVVGITGYEYELRPIGFQINVWRSSKQLTKVSEEDIMLLKIAGEPKW